MSVRTPFGEAYVRHTEYALDHRHGDRTLQSALMHGGEVIAQLAGNWAVGTATRAAPTVDLHDALFIDTETTGLAGGAGTLVFLVGVGYFAGGNEQFIVDQYFLRDPSQEVAMLCALDQLVNQRSALVTFNGRAFDVPLLESRYILSRIAPSFGDKVHLDLLLPARRVWRDNFGSCSLGSLEYHLLDVRRDQQDIAGFLIPQLYREYLQSGANELNDDMQRVMYHNLQDILSMVTLAAHLGDALVQPSRASEYLAVGAYFERQGRLGEAEMAYRGAVERLEIRDWRSGENPESLVSNLQSTALRRLARSLKRQGRISEALPHWQRLADTDDVDGLIELAKYYEWREVDLTQALLCVRRALTLSANSAQHAALEHRLERLKRKHNYDHNLSHDRSASQ